VTGFPGPIDPALRARCARIRLFASDVDGVLTDASIIYGDDQLELKAFSARDGLAMRLATWCSFPVAWVTGRTSAAVARRARELGVEVVQGAGDKAADLRALAEAHGIALDEIAFIGDDLNDLPALRVAGLPLAVADAAPEVLALAAHVTSAAGGRGAVREAIELIFRAQDCWDASVESYLARLAEAHGSRQ
jgi:3-deoxy-D-manno-octulosonate 8-phosphate phosphatase (KDO 8-P phosphatase)